MKYTEIQSKICQKISLNVSLTLKSRRILRELSGLKTIKNFLKLIFFNSEIIIILNCYIFQGNFIHFFILWVLKNTIFIADLILSEKFISRSFFSNYKFQYSILIPKNRYYFLTTLRMTSSIILPKFCSFPNW